MLTPLRSVGAHLLVGLRALEEVPSRIRGSAETRPATKRLVNSLLKADAGMEQIVDSVMTQTLETTVALEVVPVAPLEGPTIARSEAAATLGLVVAVASVAEADLDRVLLSVDLDDKSAQRIVLAFK